MSNGVPIKIVAPIEAEAGDLEQELSFPWFMMNQPFYFQDTPSEIKAQAGDEEKTKAQLIDEMSFLRRQMAKLESLNVELSRANEQLRQKVGEGQQRIESLSQHVAELQTRTEALRSFAHTVAHNLKTPVSFMTSMAEALAANYGALAPDATQGHLEEITNSGYKASSIIEELLLLAESGPQDIYKTPLDMAEIAQDVRDRLRPMLDEYQADFITPATWPIALGYGPWVEEIWANYVSNAVKYGGDPPRLELGATLQADGFVRFWVKDNGPGLTPAEQAKLFAPFSRLNPGQPHGKDRPTEGHGLGLSIARCIVKKLGGQAGVESAGRPGQGCTFYFTLPACSNPTKIAS